MEWGKDFLTMVNWLGGGDHCASLSSFHFQGDLFPRKVTPTPWYNVAAWTISLSSSLLFTARHHCCCCCCWPTQWNFRMKLLQSEPIAAATLTTIGIWKTATILFGFNLSCFQRMFIKRRLDAWGGEYHIMRFTTISIFYEKSKFMKELRTAEKGICIRLLHQHTSKSPKLYSEMCLRRLTFVWLAYNCVRSSKKQIS